MSILAIEIKRPTNQHLEYHRIIDRLLGIAPLNKGGSKQCDLTTN